MTPPSSPIAPTLLQVFDKMREGIVITDAQLDSPGPYVVYANPAFSRITGYDPSEILGRNPRMLQGSRTDRTVLDRLRRQLSVGESFEGETINYRKDGKAFVMQWYVEPLHDDAGEISHFVAVQRDVTEERTLDRQRRTLEQAIHQLVDPAVYFDAGGVISYANKSYFRWSGLSRRQVIGERIWSLPGSPGRLDFSWARRVLGQGTAWRKDYEARHRNGRRRLSVTVSPITDAAGHVEYLAVARDLTPDKRAEDRLELAL